MRIALVTPLFAAALVACSHSPEKPPESSLSAAPTSAATPVMSASLTPTASASAAQRACSFEDALARFEPHAARDDSMQIRVRSEIEAFRSGHDLVLDAIAHGRPFLVTVDERALHSGAKATLGRTNARRLELLWIEYGCGDGCKDTDPGWTVSTCSRLADLKRDCANAPKDSPLAAACAAKPYYRTRNLHLFCEDAKVIDRCGAPSAE